MITILERHGFSRVSRQTGGSHKKYEAVVDSTRRIVIVSAHREGDDVPPGTLSTIIRQSGLHKKLFR